MSSSDRRSPEGASPRCAQRSGSQASASWRSAPARRTVARQADGRRSAADDAHRALRDPGQARARWSCCSAAHAAGLSQRPGRRAARLRRPLDARPTARRSPSRRRSTAPTQAAVYRTATGARDFLIGQGVVPAPGAHRRLRRRRRRARAGRGRLRRATRPQGPQCGTSWSDLSSELAQQRLRRVRLRGDREHRRPDRRCRPTSCTRAPAIRRTRSAARPSSTSTGRARLTATAEGLRRPTAPSRRPCGQ